MTISIIIPSLNSPLIGQVLDNLQAQKSWSTVSEVLVVGKDDLTLVDEDKIIRLVDTGQPVKAPVARNIGIKESSSDLLLFLDSDCLPQENWINEHLRAQASGHQIVGGGVVPSGENYWSLSYNLTLFHEFYSTAPAGARDYLPTLNLAVQRQIIEDVGLLDETLARGQDIEWTIRMSRKGYRPYFWPEAGVVHEHGRDTVSKVWRDCARSGYYMRRVRLLNSDMIEAPWWLRDQYKVGLLSPIIAAGATGRMVFNRSETIMQHWYTLPMIYITKIAWCWGASRKTPPFDKEMPS
jgi:glycosyltransferase involved in cell wall biosynthesis